MISAMVGMVMIRMTAGHADILSRICGRGVGGHEDVNNKVAIGALNQIPAGAFSTKPGIQVSRMAASENDLYLLNAENGEVLRAVPSGSGGFELDTTFNCKPGGNNNAGPLVDILTLPITNIFGATVLGIDAIGNLLYEIGQRSALSARIRSSLFDRAKPGVGQPMEPGGHRGTGPRGRPS